MVEPTGELLAPGEVVDPYVTALAQFDAAADRLGLNESTCQYLRNNRRELIVHLPVRMDNGSVRVFWGCRVQHNWSRGPSKGGIRCQRRARRFAVRNWTGSGCLALRGVPLAN